MVRRSDSGWRDERLTGMHANAGFPCPVAGMTLPMVEYDHGRAVGIISYIRAVSDLPKGTDTFAAYQAFGKVYSASDGGMLPFLTAIYDPRDWSFKVFPHNEAAQLLVGAKRWHTLLERDFAALLYQMRNKTLPDLSAYGVEWNDHRSSHAMMTMVDVRGERWPGEHLSVRRREYEPSVAIPFNLRVPCMDIDFAVVDQDENVSLLVDYKLAGSPRDEKNSNMRALASMSGRRTGIAAMQVHYAPTEPHWDFSVYPLNQASRMLLSFAIGHNGHGTKLLADAIAGTGWLDLTDVQWLDVLRCARDI